MCSRADVCSRAEVFSRALPPSARAAPLSNGAVLPPSRWLFAAARGRCSPSPRPESSRPALTRSEESSPRDVEAAFRCKEGSLRCGADSLRGDTASLRWGAASLRGAAASLRGVAASLPCGAASLRPPSLPAAPSTGPATAVCFGFRGARGVFTRSVVASVAALPLAAPLALPASASPALAAAAAFGFACLLARGGVAAASNNRFCSSLMLFFLHLLPTACPIGAALITAGLPPQQFAACLWKEVFRFKWCVFLAASGTHAAAGIFTTRRFTASSVVAQPPCSAHPPQAICIWTRLIRAHSLSGRSHPTMRLTASRRTRLAFADNLFETVYPAWCVQGRSPVAGAHALQSSCSASDHPIRAGLCSASPIQAVPSYVKPFTLANVPPPGT